MPVASRARLSGRPRKAGRVPRAKDGYWKKHELQARLLSQDTNHFVATDRNMMQLPRRQAKTMESACKPGPVRLAA